MLWKHVTMVGTLQPKHNETFVFCAGCTSTAPVIILTPAECAGCNVRETNSVLLCLVCQDAVSVPQQFLL